MTTYNDLKRSEKRALEEALRMPSGYVLDFSNRTIDEYFEDEFGIEFYDKKYSLNGDSKAKRLRAIWATLDGPRSAKILRGLW